MAAVLVLIPARMASTRLPGKPLVDIAGEPMIVHVMRRAQAAGVGPVVVATDSEAIAACVEKAGGRALMTRADHVSGSDRIFEALAAADPEGGAEIIVNVRATCRRSRRPTSLPRWRARRSRRRHRRSPPK
jgi:3-deoxy-manno-octulosonate cytidylyltransferase (CMP-KDO synthetase)